jgi:hypothetical protein
MAKEIRKYLVEIENSDGYIEMTEFDDVIDHFTGKSVDIVFHEPNKLRDVYVTVPVWEEGRRRYSQAKLDSCVRHDYFE